MYGMFRKWIVLFELLILLLGCHRADGEVRIRKATHADDGWYPSDPSVLSKTVDGYLAKAEKKSFPGEIVAIIVPHAGYSYCGQVAAYAYKQVQGMKFDTIVLLGPSHSYGFPGASVYESGVFRNPLGDVEVDSEIAKQLISGDGAIKFIPQVHDPEHSLENQIPFLQRTLSGFKIVPILMGDSGLEACNMLSKALINVLKGKNVLLVASTDMSHFPSYDDAVSADKFTISALESMDPGLARERLDSYMNKGVQGLDCMLCGEGAVFVVMAVAKELGATSMRTLKYANSGDVSIGSKDRVVGYMAAVLFKSDGSDKKTSGENSNKTSSDASNETMDRSLDKDQQEVLLKLARESIETYLKTGKKKHLESDDERLNIKQGAFVTLRKHDTLRGCIGHIVPIEPLCDTVADMAVAAATEDPRFRKVTIDEMKDIDIEISVLSIPRRVKSADEIELGKHGVIVKRGMQQGVFLPQVATETGWSKVEFLENLCYGKAGLPKDAWKDSNTELYVFTAQLFEEE